MTVDGDEAVGVLVFRIGPVRVTLSAQFMLKRCSQVAGFRFQCNQIGKSRRSRSKFFKFLALWNLNWDA
jgi:hypothetical protein